MFDLSFIFYNRSQCNIKEIRSKLFLQYKEKWSADILHKPKLRTYTVENYVKQNIPEIQRSLCAQLRSGTLPLAVETGRFSGVPEEQRLCLLCDL